MGGGIGAERAVAERLHRDVPDRGRVAAPAALGRDRAGRDKGSAVPTGAFDGKLRPPRPRAGSVPRTALVERMLADGGRIVVVAAPPGYGKTTVLTEWCARCRLPVAWMTVDTTDNDPSALIAGVHAALRRAAPMGPFVAPSSTPADGNGWGRVIRSSSALANAGRIVLVLDQVEALDNEASLEVIAELAARVPQGSRLAIATRGRPPLPMALLRSRGDVLHIGADDLAMSRQEAGLLLERIGVALEDALLDDVLVRTEGWPAGLYLAGLAARTDRPGSNGFELRGDNRLVGDYLRSEVLEGLDASTVSFLRRTSVLDRLAGPLCDAVLESTGSQAILESLESSNLPLVPLDQHRGWFRMHRLLRDLLGADLSRSEPELAQQLHSRAATWLEANRSPMSALSHAQAADEHDRAARLIASVGLDAYVSGRGGDDVVRQLEWFRKEGKLERYPDVALLGALVEASLGRPARAECWIAGAESATRAGHPGRRTMAGGLSYVRAFMCRRGVPAMRADARLAQDELSPASPLRGGALVLEGISFMLEGDSETADPILAHGYDVALDVDALPVAAAAMAERALVAMSRRHWDDAETLAARSVAIVEEGRLEGCLEAAIVFTVAARTAIHAGDLGAGSEYVMRAARLRPALTYAAPWTAQFQLELARVHFELADPAGARMVLREMRDILRQRPDLGTLDGNVDQLQSALDAIRDVSVGASSLTVAELRLLPHLATHLSFREIGESLHVSRHTVKTQAISVYRKLGVTSRSEAIGRALEIGLLPG